MRQKCALRVKSRHLLPLTNLISDPTSLPSNCKQLFPILAFSPIVFCNPHETKMRAACQISPSPTFDKPDFHGIFSARRFVLGHCFGKGYLMTVPRISKVTGRGALRSVSTLFLCAVLLPSSGVLRAEAPPKLSVQETPLERDLKA